jgi:hypothetical protein
MTDFLTDLRADLQRWDAEFWPRSQQTATGGSDLFGCRAERVLRLNGVPYSEPDWGWQAFVGSAIDDRIGRQRQQLHPGLLTQHRTTYRNVPFTIDEFDPVDAALSDWKSKDTAAKCATAARNVTDRQRAQIHGGAAGLRAEGWTVRKVRLVFVPRAGDLSGAAVFEEPFSQAWADRGAEWAAEVGALAESVGPRLAAGDLSVLDGLRDENPRFCHRYCAYAGLCRGTPATEWAQDVQVESAPDLTAVDVDAYEVLVGPLPRIQVRSRQVAK